MLYSQSKVSNSISIPSTTKEQKTDNNSNNQSSSNISNSLNLHPQIPVKKTETNLQPNNSERNSNLLTLPGKSDINDVDKNIPESKTQYEFRFALIIGNEDYSSFQNGLSSESNVAFATNDAKIFKLYAKKTLGIPEENIIYLENAKAMEMNRAIKKINLYAKNTFGKAEIFVYYAGHGYPDEITKEPYLIPVDVSGTDLEFAVKLNDLYNSITEHPIKQATIFIDACFSGGARNQGLLAARGVKVKPKSELLKGNIIVFSASSGDQSSLSYNDKKHGMFTYFLLKKLQESKGNLNYKELSDYLTEQVGLNSIRINNKEQNPQTNISPNISNTWENWSFMKD
jgi:hypothetical protein